MSKEQADIEQVRQMTAMLQAQEFLTTVRDKCFAKCITAPGRSLSSGEQTCLQRCVDRYGEVLECVRDRDLSRGGALFKAVTELVTQAILEEGMGS